MSTSQDPEVRPGRRTVVTAAGAASVAAVLTACGGSKEAADSGRVKQTDGSEADGGRADVGGTVLAKTTDIPEGGGKIFTRQKVVVTQPTAGEFKAFSSKCTHMGCAVSSVTDGTINCPCHGSKFDMATGSVKVGPATEPLPATPITVQDGSISLAS
ncbi:nitrite reductase/ring-hydroxylating ferredoxin subunit [Streptomyces brevispora]|uniref:Cytochrome bc1 complex Rieske iron-sulfur subunit n=1 Tax=Streptomyces brevispora TaxID=887462 RepID=A0A561UQS4_9ACTN|nr:Rieske (2Fe-2S) protein [Streptomyces brevispora]TWG01722.1 nitrite reductase/ring-hydroxylating ferredoxin subunit [Streptomyces brevispora]